MSYKKTIVFAPIMNYHLEDITTEKLQQCSLDQIFYNSFGIISNAISVQIR